MNYKQEKDIEKIEKEFEKWFASRFKKRKCITGKDVRIISQIDETRYLVERSIKQYEFKGDLVVYDVEKNEWSPIKSLKIFEGSGNTDIRSLRYDPNLGIYIGLNGYYDSSRLIFQLPGRESNKKEFSLGFMKYHSKDEPDFPLIDVKIDSFFVTEEKIFLLEDKNLISLSKEHTLSELERILNMDPERKGDAISINDEKMETSVFTLNPTIGESLLTTWFSKDRLYFVFGGEYEIFTRICSILEFDSTTSQIKEYLFPYINHCDAPFFVDLYKNDRKAFLRYIIVLSLVRSYTAELFALPFFSTKGRICYPDNISYTFDIDAIEEETIEKFAPSLDLDLSYYYLFSKDEDRSRSGVLEFLRMAGSATYDDLQYIYMNHKEVILDLLEEEFDRCPFDPFFLDNAANLIKLFPDRVPMAREFLKGNHAQQYVGLLLARGKFKKSGIEAELYDDMPPTYMSSKDIEEIYTSESELPVDELKSVVEGTLEEYRKIPTIKETEKEKSRHLQFTEMLRTGVRTAGSWETDNGHAIIRYLAEQQIDEVDQEIADMIGDQGILKLQDLLLPLLDNDNPCTAESAITSIGGLEIFEAEDRILPFLGHLNDRIQMASKNALQRIGSRESLTPLFYSSILTAFLEGKWDYSNEYISIREVLERLLDKPITSKLEDEDLPEDTEMIERHAHFIFAYLFLYMIKEDEDLLELEDENYEGEVLLNIVHNHYAEYDLASHFNFETIKDYFDKRKREKMVDEFLKWFTNIEIEDDIPYLIALMFALCPGTIDFDKQNKRIETVVFHLNLILERMHAEDDFRRILAAFALLKIGIRKWEDVALDICKKDEWLRWPRLARVGEKVLDYLPEEVLNKELEKIRKRIEKNRD